MNINLNQAEAIAIKYLNLRNSSIPPTVKKISELKQILSSVVSTNIFDLNSYSSTDFDRDAFISRFRDSPLIINKIYKIQMIWIDQNLSCKVSCKVKNRYMIETTTTFSFVIENNELKIKQIKDEKYDFCKLQANL